MANSKKKAAKCLVREENIKYPLTARFRLLSCALAENNLRVSRGLRNIPEEWTLADLREKTDEELLAIPGVGSTTLDFITSFLNGYLQMRAWQDIEFQMRLYSRAYPDVYIHIHHEDVPEGCTSPFEKAFKDLYEEME